MGTMRFLAHKTEADSPYPGTMFRPAALLFLLAAVTFALINSHLAFFLDASGLSGKNPEAELKKMTAARPKKKKGPGPRAVRMPWQQPLALLPAPGTVVLDGEVNDWVFTRGAFLTDDYREQAGILSVWFHLLYDDRNLYVLARVRNPNRRSNSAAVDADPTAGECLQIQFQTDQVFAVNCWRQLDQWAIQKHIYQRRKTVYENAAAAGAAVAAKPHGDGGGVDVELKLPWTLLSPKGFAGAPAPAPGARLRLGVAARVNADLVLGRLAGSKRLDRRRLGHVPVLAEAPERPPLMALNKGDKLFPCRLGDDRVVVGWDTPIHRYRSRNPLLPCPRLSGITPDGSPDDWPLTTGIIINEDVRYAGRGSVWLHAGHDDRNLYVLAIVTDPSPAAPGDAVALQLQTTSRHQLDLVPGRLQIDGKTIGQSAHSVRRDGTGYVMEAAVPWSALGGLPAKPVPATCQARLNPKWTLPGLMSALPTDYSPAKPETWGRLVLTSAPSPSPMIVTVATGDSFPTQPAGNSRQAAPRCGQVNAYAAFTTELRLIPGTAVIDGGMDEWDLRGGVFACSDVRTRRRTDAGWIHAMYDRNALYLLARVADATARGKAKGAGDDSVTLRLVTDQVNHITMFRNVRGKDVVEFSTSPLRRGKAARLKPEQHRVKMAVRRDPGGTGYVQEAAIPWSALVQDREPPKPGEQCLLTVQLVTAPGVAARTVMISAPEFRNLHRRYREWGAGTFLAAGDLKPRPVQLQNGLVLPVAVEAGKPVVDGSLLDLLTRRLE